MTNVIVVKIENDIGNNIISLPDSISQVNNLQEQLVDLIRGCVRCICKIGSGHCPYRYNTNPRYC